MERKWSSDDVVRRGEQMYDLRIRSLVEKDNHGRFVVVNVESGDFELADDEAGVMQATDRLRSRQPDAYVYTLRVGYPAAMIVSMATLSNASS